MKKTNEKIVYVVHAVDTEGPLYESLRANFDRVFELFGHKVEPSFENLKKLQNKEIPLDGHEEQIEKILSKARIQTNSSWIEIDQMLDTITSDRFRNTVKDSFGNGWIYNWFCMSHVGIEGLNPRRRDMGYHNILDHYQEYFDLKQDNRDLLQWHYHALSITNDAHRAGSTYLNSNHVHNILTRSIIDRSWFPSVFRAGHVTERPDSNFFLEQWIPYDFSNSNFGNKIQKTSSHARFGDWRNAPKDWIPYHPNHDDYQKKGACRRYIARCLPINERAYTITSDDVSAAFDDADAYGSSILSVTNHDFRQMQPDIERVMKLLDKCSTNNKNIKFQYANAIEAMRGTCGIAVQKEIGLNVELKQFKTSNRLIVESNNNIFGPQPYLAIKIKGGTYYWQNFDFEGTNVWSYSFDVDNILIEQVEEIGVAANSVCGLTEIVNIVVDTGQIKKTILNR